MIVRYFVVGLFSTSIYYLLYQVLLAKLGAPFYLSISLAYAFFIVINFSLHRCFTFQASNSSLFQHIQKYALLLIFNYGLTYLINFISLFYYNAKNLGFILSVVVTSAVGFVISKKWVFSKS